MLVVLVSTGCGNGSTSSNTTGTGSSVASTVATEVGTTEGASTTADLEHPGGPELIIEGQGGQGDLTATWATYAEAAMELEQVDGPQGIPGFEPFNDGLRLPDGRILIRGRWDGDDPVAGWYQRNPDSVAPGEPEPPVNAVVDRPIRLFVVDATAGSAAPVSHVPVVRPFSTAVSVGEGPDVILQFVVLDGGRRVAYTAGFNGAAYDIPYVLYVAPIPPA